MLGFAGWYDNPYRDILFYTPFQHLLWIGPSSFFYTQSLLNPSFKFSKKLHLTPVAISTIHYCYLDLTNSFFGDYYFYKTDKDFEQW
jgi:hypothetical protein